MACRLSPPHTCPLANNVEDSFELVVVMRCRLGSGVEGLDHHRAGKQFVRARSYVRDGTGAGYAGGWVCVGLQVAGQNDLDEVVLPVHDLYDNRNFVKSLAGVSRYRTFQAGLNSGTPSQTVFLHKQVGKASGLAQLHHGG